MNQDRLHQIATLAGASAADPSRWLETLLQLERALGANGCALFTPEIDPEGRFLAVSTPLVASATTDYVQNWAASDAWINAATERRFFRHAGEIRSGVEALEQRALHRTEFYNGFLKPNDIEHILSLKVTDGANRLAPATHLSLYAPRSGIGFGEDHKAFLAELWPHMQRAITTHWTLARAQHAWPAVEAMLDALAQPAWIVQRDRTIEHANAHASPKAITGAAPHRWLKARQGRLESLGDLGVPELDHALANASLGGGRSWITSIFVDGVLKRAVLRVADLNEHPAFSAFWPRAHALLVLEMPPSDDLQAAWMNKVIVHYRLSPAEGRVLARLAAGLVPKEVASELQLSMATVRTHIRALFDKTGCRRQSELMRLVAGS